MSRLGSFLPAMAAANAALAADGGVSPSDQLDAALVKVGGKDGEVR